jgi:hypothetical protein
MAIKAPRGLSLTSPSEKQSLECERLPLILVRLLSCRLISGVKVVCESALSSLMIAEVCLTGVVDSEQPNRSGTSRHT